MPAYPIKREFLDGRIYFLIMQINQAVSDEPTLERQIEVCWQIYKKDVAQRAMRLKVNI